MGKSLQFLPVVISEENRHGDNNSGYDQNYEPGAFCSFKCVGVVLNLLLPVRFHQVSLAGTNIHHATGMDKMFPTLNYSLTRMQDYTNCSFFFRLCSILSDILLMSKACCQPQSLRASASSMLCGQPLAICWRKSGA